MASLVDRIRRNPRHFFLLYLTSPLVYGMLIPLILCDICASFFQSVCFRVYRIPRVLRSEHIIFDRGKLAYLTRLQKLNCIYCEYANGVASYMREILARMEWYWCPIKHQRAPIDPHVHYDQFINHEDGENYRKKLRDARTACRACEAPRCSS